MQTSGQNKVDQEKEAYLDGWAKTMVTIWLDKMDEHWVGESELPSGGQRTSSGDLRRSFHQELIKQSGGNIAKITHTFLYYGIYLDGGVFPGRGKRGENYISNPNRKSKPWRELSYGVSKKRLRDKMVELTGKDYLISIRTILVNGK